MGAGRPSPTSPPPPESLPQPTAKQKGEEREINVGSLRTKPERWFWLDLRDLRDAPCGLVGCSEAGKVVAGAPVFVKRFKGWHLNAIILRERSRGRRVAWIAL